ncbi:helix-turn-helix domain-containing protein [Tsuneonella sp. HG222]
MHAFDLQRYEQAARQAAWRSAANSLFPGLSVEVRNQSNMRGKIDQVALGSAQLCAIESAPATVRYEPGGAHDEDWRHVSLMVQSCGTTTLTQAGCSVDLQAGDMCLVDERERFGLVNHDYSSILFLRLPRAPALARYPRLDRLFGTVMPAQDCGTRLLTDVLLRISEVAGNLGEIQRAAVVNSVIQMLGVAEGFAKLPDSADWRVRRASDFIELNLSVAGITAEDVARDQGISRRRLDQLMQDELGRSISNLLWGRRMEQAAADLRDPHKARLSISQIAFANGYEDPAHFTRAFRRCHGIPPGQWRCS